MSKYSVNFDILKNDGTIIPAEFEVWYNDKTGEIVSILTKEPGDFRLIKVKEVVDDNE